MKSWLCCFAVLVALCLQQCADAAIALQFSADGSIASGDTINVNVGDSVLVEVYAFETSPNTELSVDGLFSYGIGATFNTGLGSVTNVTSDPAFPFAPFTSFNNGAGTLQSEGVVNIFAIPITTVKGSVIPVATFTYSATNPGLTTFMVGDADPTVTTSNFSADTAGSIDLDPILFGPSRTGTYNIAINAASSVPEPSSLIMSAGLLGAIGVRIRRRRRKCAESSNS